MRKEGPKEIKISHVKCSLQNKKETKFFSAMKEDGFCGYKILQNP